MDVLEFRNIYWNYYLQLENDFFSCNPYCEIDTVNDKAFSVKYLQLLLSICGEIDSICKTFCKLLDDTLNLKEAGMTDYIPILCRCYPTFANETVEICGYKYRKLQPWKSIALGYVPNWWQRYNAIKHHRDQKTNGLENYKYANQKNAIEALSALYILIEYWAAKNFVIDREEAFNRLNPDPNENTMDRLKSNRLKLDKWLSFYNSFIGPESWFVPKRFYQYLEGVDPP